MDKIDFVVTWVDGDDPEWRNERLKYASQAATKDDYLFDKWNNNEIRFRDWGLLKYWFRGVEKYAQWVNKIHFVTCGQLPSWLDTSNPKLNIVNHIDFIPGEYLPTFNSHTIELNLFRIPGLSENFVYFNDDMFIIDYVKKEDFFRDDLPCDSAVLNVIPIERNIDNADFVNIGIINDYFSKNQVIREHPFQWFNLKYGSKLIRNFLLLPWHLFPGIYEPHISINLKKSTCEKLWELEPELFDRTCRCKFRDHKNISPWLFRLWQIVTGEFYPRNLKLGRMFLKEIDDEICKWVKTQKTQIVCINDSGDEEHYTFEEQKEMLHQAFESVLGEKSSFEK